MTESAVQEVTMQDLGKLPLRATVAFAVRCAQRVQPMLRSEADTPARTVTLERAQAALAPATRFAQGDDDLPTPEELRELGQQTYDAADQLARNGQSAASAAGHTAGTTAVALEIARQGKTREFLNFVACAWGSYRVVLSFVTGLLFKDMFTGNMVLHTLRADYDRLLEMHLGKPAELGQPVDPGEQGPLGPLWPEGAPCWLAK